MAFQIAGSMGAQAAAREAGPVLLEPVMEVEVLTPDEFMGEVMGNLSARRGRVSGMEARGSAQAISGRGAAGDHVRLFHRRPFHDPRTGDLHDAVRALCAGPDARDRVDRRAMRGA